MQYRSRWKAFANAFRGIYLLVRHETHGTFHLFAAFVVVATGIVLEASLEDWCWLCLCVGLVFITELMNTSIERLADRVTTDFDELIRDAKDLAAGAVVLAALTSATIGLIRFVPLVLRAIEN
ncbi:diacylglycerol kinase family protein [Pirellulaceae bacterium SH449]